MEWVVYNRRRHKQGLAWEIHYISYNTVIQIVKKQKGNPCSTGTLGAHKMPMTVSQVV